MPEDIPAPGAPELVESYQRLADVFHEVLAEQSLDALLVRIADALGDLIPHDTLIAMETRIQNLVPGSVFVSTVTAEGLEPLRRSLLSAARKRRPLSEIRLPLSDGKLLAEIHREAEVLEQRHEGEELVLVARLDDALAGKLRRAGAGVIAG
jgi:GTP-binding protein HflX